ncbi:MAG: hypothetical protein L0211_22880 [Planctomycetaceae bacterium]|nr:hypothetical protein [Planctomycetaceae bacterium]
MSWLVIACLKNALLALPLVIAALAVGRLSRRPAFAHVLWVLVLVKLITPPLVDVPLGSRFDFEAWLAEDSADSPREAVAAAAPSDLAMIVAATTGGPSASPDLAPTAAAAPSVWSPLASRQVRQIARSASTWMQSPSWGLVVALAGGIWLLGSAATAAMLFVRARRFQRYLLLACRDDERLTVRVRQLSYRTGLISYPKVVVVEGVVSPMLWGLGSNVRLLFPSKLVERLGAAETDALLLHELAHYSRGDYWVRLLELVTYVAYWWNPVVWWACRQIEAAEEQCCDAWVVEHQSGTRRSYAEALLATIDFLNEPAEVRPPAACGLGEVSLLRLRLTQIMRGQLAPQMPRTAWLVVLVCGLALAPLQPALFATSSRQREPAPSVVADVVEILPVREIALSPADIAPLLVSESSPPAPPAVIKPAPAQPAARNTVPPTPVIAPRPAPIQPSRLYGSVFSANNRFKLEGFIGHKMVLVHPSTGWRLDLGNHRVNCVSFSPDSRFFITGHQDGKLRQWDSETGGLMATLATNAGVVTSVAYSPDGRQFALGTFDGVVSVWDAATLEEVARRTTGRGAVSCVRWCPRGERLAIALGDWSAKDQSRLHLWSPSDSVLLSDEALEDAAGALDWLSDDALLVAYWDGHAVVRNVRGNAVDQVYEVEKDLVSSANWSSDVRLVSRWVADKLAAGAGL